MTDNNNNAEGEEGNESDATTPMAEIVNNDEVVDLVDSDDDDTFTVLGEGAGALILE